MNYERRNHRRLQVDLPIEYWPVGGLKSRPGRVVEIDEAGFQLSLREEIEIAQKLRISLLIDSGSEFMLIEPLVQVVWKETSSEGTFNHIRSGVRIIDIAAREFRILKGFLHILRSTKASTKAPIFLDLL